MNIIDKIKNVVNPENEWFRTYSLVSAVQTQSGSNGCNVNWQSFAFDMQMYDTRNCTFAKAAMKTLLVKASEIIEEQVEMQAMNALPDTDNEVQVVSEYIVIRRSEHQFDLVRRTDNCDVVVLSATDMRC